MSDSSDQNFHEYDGIIEHDNPLPTWWLWSFFLAIIFSFIYYLHYELAGGPTLTQELTVAMAELESAKSSQVAAAPLETEESLEKSFNENGLLDLGAAQFSSKCAACHGNELQGTIGPNLTDKFWIHGHGDRLSMLKVIREGIPDKGMPPWGSVMKRNELYAVTAYIISKKGSQPVGAKAPQGEPSENYLK